jgi:PmbA protein
MSEAQNSSLADRLVQAALQRGAQAAQASLNRSETSDVSFENNHLKYSETAQRTEINLKVIVDGKAGSSSTTDPADIDGLVSRALAAAAFGSPVLFELPGPQPACDVKTVDPALAALTRPEMVAMGSEVLETVNEFNPEIQFGVGFRRRLQHVEFANSAGAGYADDFTHYQIGAEGMLVRENDIFNPYVFRFSLARNLDTNQLAQQVLERFRLAERSASIPSGLYPVIFTPEGLNAILLTLMLALNGKNAALGQSPLAGKLGQQIADPRFTLVDNPLIDFARNSARYDGEGVPKQITPLIENGVLKNFLYDLDSAARAGAKSTGSGPGPSPSNWIVTPGSTSLEAMLGGTRQGLLVHDFLGLGQGNPISGEFSVNVQEGYKIEDGQLVGRVKDVMLSGNVYDLLQRILYIGDRPEWMDNFVAGYLPHIQFDALSVTAR